MTDMQRLAGDHFQEIDRHEYENISLKKVPIEEDFPVWAFNDWEWDWHDPEGCWRRATSGEDLF